MKKLKVEISSTDLLLFALIVLLFIQEELDYLRISSEMVRVYEWIQVQQEQLFEVIKTLSHYYLLD